MPETVGGYHLFQLCLGLGPGEGIRFEELETDLGSGFGTSTGFGINTGIRNWKISFPTIAGFTASANVSYKGSLLTPAEYVWALFCDSKVSGDPFVVQSPINDQYYLARFADRELDYTRGLTKLFSTGMMLKQWRVEGVSVFDITKLPHVWTWLQADTIPGLSDGDPIDGDWIETPAGYGHSMNTNAIYHTNQQNSLPAVRWNGTSTIGTLGTGTFYDIFFVMKVRNATWPNYGGVLTANLTTEALVGDSGTTKFTNQGLGSSIYEYRLNGVLKAESDQQAPMNEFGLVHARYKNGITLASSQVGKDRGYTGRWAAMDIADILLIDTKPLPGYAAREVTERMITHWNL